MATTFLTHSKCGGPVVIDASSGLKFIAPSFSVGQGGVSKITLDIQVINSGRINPAYQCIKCGDSVGNDDLGDQVVVTCGICGRSKPASDIKVHTHISAICSSCTEQIKNPDNGQSVSVARAVEMFGITKSARLTDLVKILLSPINL